ncbi:pyridoxamine 5'-phosphate oxidase family protein [Roseovarius rhodophyticola]|uniref:Pyridoxamine 5'-phosphate oxidase family protein n=1 Tax=Roseovarius rhodophyticola TaxID=3080827 RepID=A0ABZ2TLW8_9RHOB|nr:pyridoxamine 5'-phosphate oxidase family protein [Roseovarius sp. W115]MDV2929044.1 pyridoxamine 5'-phosphate oxidase family protein [Roseovarius sp. W115]
MGTAQGLNATLRRFIEEQPMFFVATADISGRVNVSPKGMDTLRVLSDSRIKWLNLSGSGNETAAHVQATGRMTLMFCAFEGPAMILRVYGTAKVVHPKDGEWKEVISGFPEIAGSRQVFDLAIELVQTSCGTGVPIMNFQESRADKELVPFYEKMGENGVRDYWRRKNTQTIDGKPTGILDDS